MGIVFALFWGGRSGTEPVHESIECSGAGAEPYTDAQFEAVAQLVAAASRALGIAITRSTVVVHADVNRVSRRSDPWPPATREARVRRVIARGERDPAAADRSGHREDGRHRPRDVTGEAMDTQPGTIWGREPAMALALVQAVIALVVAFGLNLAPDQIGAIHAATAVILGLVMRSRVSPA